MMEKSNESLQLLKKCPTDKVEQFLHRIIDDICVQRPPLYSDYSDIWTLTEWWEVSEVLKKFICRVASLGDDKEKVSAMLSQLPQSCYQPIASCLSIRSCDIRQVLMEKTCAVSGTSLSDFDWKLKLVLASDKLSNIKEPYLELDMALQDGCDKELCIEMSKDELKGFIDSLEAANKVIVPMLT